MAEKTLETEYQAVENPRSNETYRVRVTTAEQIRHSAHALREAQPGWSAAGAGFRARILTDWRNAIARKQPALQSALEADTGRRMLAGVEIDAALRRIDYWCERAAAELAQPPDGRSETAPNVLYRHQLVPMPLIGVISPWNFPLLLTVTDALPALMAGCAVLAKPSEITSRFVEPLTATIDAVPGLAAVLHLVTGAAKTGRALIDQVDCVCFTGSVASGRKVGAQAGRRIIPAYLELGGKDPFIVLEDARLDDAVTAALRASCISTGQACQSIERIYVHETLYDGFLERLVRAAKKITTNLETIDRGHLGPFIDKRQAAVVRAHLEDARAKGAVQHCGELMEKDGGIWCTPIVLSRVNHDMLIMTEETFGPVAPVMRFADDEEAVAYANDSRYGLSAAVFGEQTHAVHVARRVNAGAVSINDGGLTTQVSDVEKDAFGLSGTGRSRMGPASIRRFMRRKSLLIQTGTAVPLDSFREEAGS